MNIIDISIVDYAINEFGCTYVIMTSIVGYIKTATYLIDKKANINAKNKN